MTSPGEPGSEASPDPAYAGQLPGVQPPVPTVGMSGYGEAPPLDSGIGPSKSRLGVVIAMCAVVVIVAAGGGLLWWANSGGSDEHTVATQTTTTDAMSPPTLSPQPPSPLLTCNGHLPSKSANTPAGWQTVVTRAGLSYDVPADWKVNRCSAVMSWDKPCSDGPFGYCSVLFVHGGAGLDSNTCPDANWSHAVSGVETVEGSDIGQVLHAEMAKVPTAYTSTSGAVPSVSISPQRQIAVGGAPGVAAVATLTGVQEEGCPASTGVAFGMAVTTVPGGHKPVMFAISLGQGYPGALPASLIDQIVATLRPAN